MPRGHSPSCAITTDLTAGPTMTKRRHERGRWGILGNSGNRTFRDSKPHHKTTQHGAHPPHRSNHPARCAVVRPARNTGQKSPAKPAPIQTCGCSR